MVPQMSGAMYGNHQTFSIVNTRTSTTMIVVSTLMIILLQQCSAFTPVIKCSKLFSFDRAHCHSFSASRSSGVVKLHMAGPSLTGHSQWENDDFLDGLSGAGSGDLGGPTSEKAPAPMKPGTSGGTHALGQGDFLSSLSSNNREEQLSAANDDDTHLRTYSSSMYPTSIYGSSASPSALSSTRNDEVEVNDVPEEDDPYKDRSPRNTQEGSGMFQRLMKAKEAAEQGQTVDFMKRPPPELAAPVGGAAPATASPGIPSYTVGGESDDSGNTLQQQTPPPPQQPQQQPQAAAYPYYPPPPPGYPYGGGQQQYPPAQGTTSSEGQQQQAAAYPYYPPPPPGYPYYPPPPQGAPDSTTADQTAATAYPPPAGAGGYPYPPMPYGYPYPYYPPPPPQQGTEGADGQQQAAYYPPPPPGYPPYGSYPPPPQQQPSQTQAVAGSAAGAPPPPSTSAMVPPGAPPLPAPETLLGGVGSGASAVDRPMVNPTTGEKMRPPDKIANTADLYLETLKLDTATRARAFQRGDVEESNKVFADPRISQLKDSLLPYLQSETRRQDITTVPEEMLPYVESEKQRWRDGDNVQEEEQSYTGISYKERLAKRRKNKDPQQ